MTQFKLADHVDHLFNVLGGKVLRVGVVDLGYVRKWARMTASDGDSSIVQMLTKKQSRDYTHSCITRHKITVALLFP